MKEVRKISFFLVTGGLMFSFIVSESCKKKASAPTAIILVLDSAKKTPINGATVTLQLDSVKSPVTSQSAQRPNPDHKLTDSGGEVTFTLKYEASYNADVFKAGYKLKKSAVLVRFRKNQVLRDTVFLGH